MSKLVKSENEITNTVPNALYERICSILEEARSRVARTVNSEMVQAYWQIGREIVLEEQKGQKRAKYGEQMIINLSRRLQKKYGKGVTPANLRYMRLFYLRYQGLIGDDEICHAVRDKFNTTGRLNSELSWTHYRLLTKVESPHARAFYEIETVANNWSYRELERQINSLLYERLAKSRDKKGLIQLAKKGQEIQRPEDVIKDPLVLEFLDLPESHKLVESKLETALIDDLKKFLLELGKGFAFIERQKRLTLDGDHFYADLVFYHTILKCYVLIDLKTTKLTHADLGQMQLYVNYYDEECRAAGDNPTVGLILCTDKNDTVVRYTLAKGKQRIFASRYKLYLPTEEELKKEIQMERRVITSKKK